MARSINIKTSMGKSNIGSTAYYLLALFTVRDFEFIWPENNFRGLLFLAAAFAAISFYELWKIGRTGWGRFTAVMCFVLAGAVDTVVGPNLSIETETHGWLQPANDPTPPNVCKGVADKPGTLTVIIGNATFVSTKEGEEIINQRTHRPRIGVLDISACHVISIIRSDQGLNVDADVFDRAGNLAVRIEDNEFHIVAAEISYPERPDRSTLTVHDKQGGELFWVRYLNPSAVRIKGVFACARHPPVTFTDSEMRLSGGRVMSGTGFCAIDPMQAGIGIDSP